MKAIILVGGEGTRLRPLTYTVVKSMVPVINKPFIEHVIRRLAAHGINEIVLAMGYKPDSIFEYFRKSSTLDIKLTYSLEEKPLGTAGAVKHAGSQLNETFFVLNGDVYTDIDYTDMLTFHRLNKAKATIALTRVEDPTKFGVVETDQNGRVQHFIEKPSRDKVTSHWVNAGIYILEPDVLNYIPEGDFYMFERGVFPDMLAKGESVYAYTSDAYWIDMGTPEKYHQLNCNILGGSCASPLHNGDKVVIDSSSRVHPTARITAPVIIDGNCVIEERVELKGPVVLGKGCLIKKGTLIENSLLWDNVVVGKNASIINSILASGVKIKDKARLEGQTLNQENGDAANTN
ncbi:MAG: NDP-sugar synthase [Dehalococcoidia bacterium]|jgi:mannose-1-phosphate guanylyltransferase